MTTVSAVVFIYGPDTNLASVAVLNMDDAGDIAPAAAMGMMIFYTAASVRLVHFLVSKFLRGGRRLGGCGERGDIGYVDLSLHGQRLDIKVTGRLHERFVPCRNAIPRRMASSGYAASQVVSLCVLASVRISRSARGCVAAPELGEVGTDLVGRWLSPRDCPAAATMAARRGPCAEALRDRAGRPRGQAPAAGRGRSSGRWQGLSNGGFGAPAGRRAPRPGPRVADARSAARADLRKERRNRVEGLRRALPMGSVSAVVEPAPAHRAGDAAFESRRAAPPCRRRRVRPGAAAPAR